MKKKLLPALVAAAILRLAFSPAQAALLSENFNASNGGFTAETPMIYDGPWIYEAASGSWRQDGQGPENQHPNTSMLNSPAINITQSGTVQLTFAHRHSFEQGFWDGGQVRVGVNGGAFTAVPAGAFSQNGYNGTVLANSASVLVGQAAFVQESVNFAGGFITSICTLGSFQAGDSIRVQFIAGADTNTRGNFQPNWQIDSISVIVFNPPVLDCPTNVVVECSGGLTPVTYTVTASDENGPVLVTCIPPSGSGFRVGTSNVTCSASNATGTSTCTFTVTVEDTTPSNVSCPTNIITQATSPSGAVATYVASASDACGIASFDCTPPSGSTFPIGTNTVICIVVDAAGNTNACSFFVIVLSTSTNRCPTAGPLSVRVEENSSVSTNLPASDPDGDPLQYSVTKAPAHGTVVLQTQTGAFTYTPAPGFCGPDSFKYGVTDGNCTTPVEASVSITMTCLNQCPVAVATVSPTASIDCVGLSNVVIAANSAEACVLLDGSASSDPDGDLLTYAWLADLNGDTIKEIIAVGALATNCLPVGAHEVSLVVSDGRCSATNVITIEVISPCEAVGALIAIIESSDLPRNRQRPLVASLKAACASFQDGRLRPGVLQLEAFQNKVRAQVVPLNTALAQQLVDCAQVVIDLADGR